MLERLSLRKWATPITIGAFLLMSVTGVVMFFDWEPGLTTVIHQWFSWIFLTAAVAHVVLNLRPFKLHFKSVWGRASIIAFGLVLMVSFFSWGAITGPQLKDPIERYLVDAPLSALAGVTRSAPEQLIRRFAQHGYAVSPQHSIRHLVERYGVDENILLAIIFLPEMMTLPDATQ